ncbi:MAG: cytochrome c oxidase subunit II, partial [SAR324 cluster bacterium]|nr:cytochrome c oxidase subunit II [SAR324 cluster bacterium]
MATQIWIGLQRATGRYLWAFAGFALAGCFGGGKQSTIQPESDSAQIIQDVYALVTWIDLGILIVVGGMLLVAMVRYRESRQTDVDIPKQVHGNIKLEIIWTTVPAILLIFIAIPTWQGIFRAAAPPRTEALQIEAIGHQWWWEFRYPTLGIVTANEMHVPVGKPVVIKTYSVDVIHSFWLPRLAAKIDTLPGKSNEVWFTPHNVGKYYGQCAEFCGTSHANMRMLAFVDSEADFDKWAARQEQAPVPTTPDARDGMQLFAQKACVACHTIKGMAGAVGVLGPNLNDLANRHTIASATFDNTPENLSRWIRNSQAMKPGALMILPFE